MNEQNKKLLECAEFIKENCENKNNQNARCLDCPAKLKGNGVK